MQLLVASEGALHRFLLMGFFPANLEEEILGSLNYKEAGLGLLIVEKWLDLKGAEKPQSHRQ